MDNNSLRERALQVIADLREFLTQHGGRIDREPGLRSIPREASEEEKRRLFWEGSERIISNGSALQQDYKQRLQREVLDVRDALVAHIPGIEASRPDRFYYEYPTNPLGIEMITEDLERMVEHLQKDAPEA